MAKGWSRRTEMASIKEQQRRVSQGRRRAKKTEFRWLKLLLLMCLINPIGSVPEGNTPQPVMGEEGGNATLPCEFQLGDDFHIVVFRQSKNILDCQNGECKRENIRVFKVGACDIIITHLIFSDAGKYILKVYNTDGQIEVKRKFQLHIQGEISVKTGDQLELDILLINADKVEKNSSGEWTEVWTSGHGVRSDRLTVRDGKLIISNFTVNDTGTYEVLDSEEKIWITVTVTGSSSGSKGKLDTDEDKPNDTEERTVESRIIVVSVIGALLVLVIFALIWKHRQNRNS